MKHSIKQISLITLLLAVPLLLSGCGMQDGGAFHNILVVPFTQLIKFFASFFNGSYGAGIVIVTLLVRFLVMPLMLNSFKKQKKMQFKMKKAKPEIDAINKRMKEVSSQEEQQALTQEMMALYKKHDINPMNMGCLPILIQMPILMALYFAIIHNPELASQNFLWFNLGTPNLAMALLAGLMYLVQSMLSMRYMPKETEMQGPMKMMMFMSPLMILFISFNAPAALPLYWSVGALVLILQQYLSNKYFNYHEDELEEEADEEFKEENVAQQTEK